MKLTQEMMEKARAAKTAEDLLLLANENGISITAQEADIYLAQLHPTDGELADNELDDVSGGLVQLVNPSSENRQCFHDGTVCQHCGQTEKYQVLRCIVEAAADCNLEEQT